MTVRWVEGFEIDQDSEYIRGKYQNRPGAVTTDTGRVFGLSAQLLTLVTPALIASPGPEWIVGFGLKLGSTGDDDLDFMKIFNGGLDQIAVHFRADNRLLEVRRGATVLATTVVALPPLDWAYIEFKCLVHASAGSYELRINGTTELTASGIDTSFSNLNDADVVMFSGSANHRIDDIYILDTAGGVNADFLGPRVVEGLLPFADGDVLQWGVSAGGDHFAVVDDPASAFDVTDFNEDKVVGQKDLYVFQALSQITGDINAVAIGCMVGLDGVGSRTYKTIYRSKTDAEGDGPTFTVDSTLPLNHVHIMEQDPSGTPDRWTLDDVLAGQFGLVVVS